MGRFPPPISEDFGWSGLRYLPLLNDWLPMKKSTVDEIRERFDNDVERFSNLATGQSATIDAPLA